MTQSLCRETRARGNFDDSSKAGVLLLKLSQQICPGFLLWLLKKEPNFTVRLGEEELEWHLRKNFYLRVVMSTSY
jgi:hypothetical protein